MRFHRGDSPTMEEVFNVLFISKDMPRIFFRGGKPRNPGHRREIDDFVSVVVGILRYVQVNARDREGVDHHARLVSSLGPSDALISLNYDTLIDNALLMGGWNPRLGYGFELPRRKIRIRDSYPKNSELEDVLLIKPHGSLNWFSRGSVKNYERVLLGRRPPRVQMSSVPRANVSRGFVRLFIPPLYVKFFANPFWRRLWERSFERLRKADALVIIGCSLIETDFHLRSIMGTALARRPTKFKRIVLVEPNATVVRRLKSYLRGRGEDFAVYKDFTAFVQTLG